MINKFDGFPLSHVKLVIVYPNNIEIFIPNYQAIKIKRDEGRVKDLVIWRTRMLPIIYGDLL